MNIKTKLLSPQVKNPKINSIAKPTQWLLKSGGKNPKNRTVQENPTGADFTCPVLGFSK